MKTFLSFFLLLLLLPVGAFAVDEDTTLPFFTWDLLLTGAWSGSYKISDEEELSTGEFFSGGTLLNRGDLHLGFPQQYISLRFQLNDRRRLPPDAKYEPVFNPGFGFYYSGGGAPGTYLGSARLLRGILDEQGLSARVRNVWAKSAPFAENRKPFTVDLRNAISTTREPETSVFLETPILEIPVIGLSRFYASSSFDDEFNPAISSGMEARWSKTGNLRLDAFYTERELEYKKTSAWFSASPPLPERDFRLWALGTVLNMGDFGFAFDGAYSETFAYGADIYANMGFRYTSKPGLLGSRPWKFSLAVDGAGPRFVDRAGAAVGAGFRLAGRAERQWIRSGLFRTNLLLRSSSFGGDFDRGSFSVYYRPSSPPPRQTPWFRFTRASISLGRDARVPHKTNDSLDLLAGFNFGSFRTVFSWNLDTLSVQNSSEGFLFRMPFFQSFDSSKMAGELTWGTGIFNVKGKLGFTARAEKDPLWDISVNTSIKPGKAARFGLKVASPDFPEKWNYSVSYRMVF